MLGEGERREGGGAREEGCNDLSGRGTPIVVTVVTEGRMRFSLYRGLILHGLASCQLCELFIGGSRRLLYEKGSWAKQFE